MSLYEGRQQCCDCCHSRIDHDNSPTTQCPTCGRKRCERCDTGGECIACEEEKTAAEHGHTFPEAAPTEGPARA